jgi:hypothetical protein
MTDQAGPTKRQPREIWAEMKATKYSDDKIRQLIDNVNASLKYDWDNCGMAEIATAQTARAMIAYNEMIDERIERAQRSLRMK